MYGPVFFLARFILTRVGRIAVRHAHHLPASGGYVLACTHVGWSDPIWLAIAVWPRRIHYMAKQELFRNRLVAWVLRQLQAFPVNRIKPGPSSLKIPLRLLQHGQIVGIFPSGTRTQDETPLKKGATTIAQLAAVPIVPAVYDGPPSFHVADLFRRRAVTVTFGPPITLPAASADWDAATQRAHLLEQVNVSLQQLADSLHPAVPDRHA